ncbi:hypothetical protein HDV06_003837 [Boothiomyces sp. JEL0866]|nr:hypothetical protein HDV06_003837 [Boothiomyces sp. JEL0866]
MSNFTREKLNTAIKYPPELDLSAMFPKEAQYELITVLLHKGNTAHSGHYILKSKVDGKWYVFDDENVYVDLNFEKELQSDSVYSLVYRKKPNPEQISKREVDFTSVIPESIKSNILSDNSDYTKFVTSSNINIEKLNMQNSEKLEILEQLFKIWQPKDTGVFLSFHWLKNVMDDIKAKVLEGSALEVEAKDTGKSSTNPILVDEDIIEEVIIQEDIVQLDGIENATSLKEINNVDVMCEHGKLDPVKIPDTKRISAKGMELLRKLDIVVSPLSEDDICLECFEAQIQSRLEDFTHGIDYNKLKNLPKQNGAKYFVSSEWLNEWKKRYPKFEQGGIPSPLSSPYDEHVYCNHGNRSLDSSKLTAIPENVYNLINARYGIVLPSNEQDSCKLCSVVDYKDRVEDELKHLRRLLKSKSIFIQNQMYYLLPTLFLVEWRKFIKTKANPVTFIDTTHLLCKHEQMTFLPSDNNNFSDFVYVTVDEWEYLMSKYPLVGKAITMINQETDPKTCTECRLDRLSDFKSAIINIYKRGADSAPVKKGTKTRGSALKKKNLRLDVFPYTTVQDLKDETLFFKGRELEANETMKGIKILPEELIEVEIFEPDEELLFQQEEELGFYGTALG